MDRYLKSLVQITPANGNHSFDYAITITLRPKIYSKPYEDQFTETATNINRLFPSCRLTLIAELTQTENIHYHGVISIPLSVGPSPTKYFFDQLRKLSAIGKSECKQLMHWDTWKEYLNKDIKKNIDLNYFYPIVRDDYDLVEKIQ